MITFRLGSWAAAVVVGIGLAYLLVLAVGFGYSGFDQPIVDPVLAVMEVLTLLSAPPIVVTMAAIHGYAPDDRKVFATIALAFTVLFAGATSAVHFVALTASRQLGSGGLEWPSPGYAVELLAWDWFLGLALMFAAGVFRADRGEKALRYSLWVSGALAFAGTIGPITGDMRLQRIGILGYAGVLPVAFFLIARFFRRQLRDHQGRPHRNAA